MYLGEFCKRDGVAELEVEYFSGFGERSRHTCCSHFERRERQDKPPMISVMNPQDEEGDSLVRFKRGEGQHREMVDGVWVWFQDSEE
jgi:hypothetical protein